MYNCLGVKPCLIDEEGENHDIRYFKHCNL